MFLDFQIDMLFFLKNSLSLFTFFIYLTSLDISIILSGLWNFLSTKTAFYCSPPSFAPTEKSSSLSAELSPELEPLILRSQSLLPNLTCFQTLCSSYFKWGLKVSEPFSENILMKLFHFKQSLSIAMGRGIPTSLLFISS